MPCNSCEPNHSHIPLTSWSILVPRDASNASLFLCFAAVAYLTLDDPSAYEPSNSAYQLPIMAAGHLPRDPITTKFTQLGCFSNVLMTNGFNPGSDWESCNFANLGQHTNPICNDMPTQDVNHPMVEQCAERCAGLGHLYSAIYRGPNYCYCGSVVPLHRDWSSSNLCNACPDAGNYVCGGSMSMAVSENGPPSAFDLSLAPTTIIPPGGAFGFDRADRGVSLCHGDCFRPGDGVDVLDNGVSIFGNIPDLKTMSEQEAGWSLSFWVYPITGGSGWQPLIGAMYPSTGWGMWLTAGQGGRMIHWRANGQTYDSPSNTLRNDEWNHIMMIATGNKDIDGHNGGSTRGARYHMVINGVRVRSQDINSNPNDTPETTIGSWRDHPGERTTARMDDVRWFDQALFVEDAIEIYGGCPAPMVQHTQGVISPLYPNLKLCLPRMPGHRARRTGTETRDNAPQTEADCVATCVAAGPASCNAVLWVEAHPSDGSSRCQRQNNFYAAYEAIFSGCGTGGTPAETSLERDRCYKMISMCPDDILALPQAPGMPPTFETQAQYIADYQTKQDHCRRQDAAFITLTECSSFHSAARGCGKVTDCLNSGSWRMSTSEQPVGAWVKMTFRESYKLTSMAFSHRDYSDNYWEKFGRVRLEFSDNSVQIITLKGDDNFNHLYPLIPVDTTFVKVVVESVYHDHQHGEGNDPGASEIWFHTNYEAGAAANDTEAFPDYTLMFGGTNTTVPPRDNTFFSALSSPLFTTLDGMPVDLNSSYEVAEMYIRSEVAPVVVVPPCNPDDQTFLPSSVAVSCTNTDNAADATHNGCRRPDNDNLFPSFSYDGDPNTWSWMTASGTCSMSSNGATVLDWTWEQGDARSIRGVRIMMAETYGNYKFRRVSTKNGPRGSLGGFTEVTSLTNGLRDMTTGATNEPFPSNFPTDVSMSGNFAWYSLEFDPTDDVNNFRIEFGENGGCQHPQVAEIQIVPAGCQRVGGAAMAAGLAPASLNTDSCLEARNAGVDVDGVYDLDGLPLYCDMTTDGGGWTLVLTHTRTAEQYPGITESPLVHDLNVDTPSKETPYSRDWSQLSNSQGSPLIAPASGSEWMLYNSAIDEWVRFEQTHTWCGWNTGADCHGASSHLQFTHGQLYDMNGNTLAATYFNGCARDGGCSSTGSDLIGFGNHAGHTYHDSGGWRAWGGTWSPGQGQFTWGNRNWNDGTVQGTKMNYFYRAARPNPNANIVNNFDGGATGHCIIQRDATGPIGINCTALPPNIPTGCSSMDCAACMTRDQCAGADVNPDPDDDEKMKMCSWSALTTTSAECKQTTCKDCNERLSPNDGTNTNRDRQTDPDSNGEYVELVNGDTVWTSDYYEEPSNDRRDVGQLFDCESQDWAGANVGGIDHCGRANSVAISTSSCSSQYSGSWECAHATDCSLPSNSMWCTSNEQVGAWINMNFVDEYVVTGMSFSHRENSEMFKDVRLEFSDGTSQMVLLLNNHDQVLYPLEPVKTTFVKVVCVTKYSGSNIGASEIWFTSDPAALTTLVGLNPADNCDAADRGFHSSCRKGRDYLQDPLILRYNFKRSATGLLNGIPQANYTQNTVFGSDTQVVSGVRLHQGADPNHAVGRVDLKYRKHDGSIVVVPNAQTGAMGAPYMPYMALADDTGPWRGTRDCTLRAFDGRDSWDGSTSWHFREWTYFLWDKKVDVHKIEWAQCCGSNSGDGHTARNLLVQYLEDGFSPESPNGWTTFRTYEGTLRRTTTVNIDPGDVTTKAIRIAGGVLAPGSGRDTPDEWYRFNYVNFVAYPSQEGAVGPQFAKPSSPLMDVTFDPIETDMLEFNLYPYQLPTCDALISEMDHCSRRNAAWVKMVECSTQYSATSYACNNAIDCGDDAWVTRDQQAGATIKLTFRKDTLITGMSFRHRGGSERFARVRLEFSDGTSQLVNLLNDGSTRRYPLTPVATEWVKLIAETIHSGSNMGAREIWFYQDASALDLPSVQLGSCKPPANIPAYKNCAEILYAGASTGNGIYTIFQNRRITDVYCDMVTDGGGWTLWQDFGGNDRWGLGPGPRTDAEYEALGWTISRGQGTARGCDNFGNQGFDPARSNSPSTDPYYGIPGDDYLQYFHSAGTNCAISKDLPSEGVDEIMMKGGASTADTNGLGPRLIIANPSATDHNRQPEETAYGSPGYRYDMSADAPGNGFSRDASGGTTGSQRYYPGHLEHIFPAAPSQRFWMDENNGVATIYWIFYRHKAPEPTSPWVPDTGPGTPPPMCSSLTAWKPDDAVLDTSIVWGGWTPNANSYGSAELANGGNGVGHWGDSWGCGGAGQCKALMNQARDPGLAAAARQPDENIEMLKSTFLLQGNWDDGHGPGHCPDVLQGAANMSSAVGRTCPWPLSLDMERWAGGDSGPSQNVFLANPDWLATAVGAGNFDPQGPTGPPLGLNWGWGFANGRFTVNGVTVHYQLCHSTNRKRCGQGGGPGTPTQNPRMQGGNAMAWKVMGAAEMNKIAQLGMLSGQTPSADCFRHQGDDDVMTPGGSGTRCECTGRPEFCTLNYDGSNRPNEDCGRDGCAGLAEILHNCNADLPASDTSSRRCIVNGWDYDENSPTAIRLISSVDMTTNTVTFIEEAVPRNQVGDPYVLVVSTTIDTICTNDPAPEPEPVPEPEPDVYEPSCIGLSEVEIRGCATCTQPRVTSDADGKCPMDIDGDGSTSISDLLAVLSAFGMNNCDLALYDFNGDCQIGVVDLLGVLANFGCTACGEMEDPTCGGEEGRGVCRTGVCVCTDDWSGEICTVPATRSCATLLAKDPSLQSGMYTIQDDTYNNGQPLQAYCDMSTDGGGYTMVPCDGCASGRKAWQPNGCTDMGLQWLVPRTQDHWCSLYNQYSNYWSSLTGVVSRHSGARGNNWTPFAMNSGTGTPLTDNWVAIDGGSWWLRGSSYGEPNGDNCQGCWLGGGSRNCGSTGNSFNDLSSGYDTGSRYMCSTNDKGGPGLWNYQDPATGLPLGCVDAGCNCAPDCRRP